MANGPTEYGETQVDDLMNVVYNDVNGEYVYLLQLGDDGEVVGASDEQGFQYVILKTAHNPHDEGEVEAPTEINIDNLEQFQHNHNGSEEIATGYEDEQEILGGVSEEQSGANEQYAESEGMDHEQVSAATQLLEFHNQQPLIVGGSEVFETEEPNEEDLKPDAEELLNLLAETSQDEMAPAEPGEKLHVKFSSGARTYGKNLTEIKTEIKEEEPDANLTESQVRRAGLRRAQPVRKRRRTIFDHVKVISNSEFKKQLQNTSDIVGKLDIAPKTKKAMSQLAFSGVGKYFAYPGRKVHGMPLAQLFYTRLKVNVEPPLDSQQVPLQPLPADLSTPGISDPQLPPLPPLEQIGSHECVETVLRKTVDSFDNIIKGMKTDKRKQMRKAKASEKS